MKRVMLVIGLVLLSMVPILGVSCTSENVYTPEKESPTSSQKLVILEHHRTVSEFGSIVVAGKAKNVTNENFSYAEIRVKFLDSGGAVLETSLDNINDLGPSQTWSFEVMYFGLDESKVATYEIAVGTIF